MKAKLTKWYSYDEIAEVYEQIMVPHFFVRPATDLLDMLALAKEERMLDLGSGTGVGILGAKMRLGPESVVVGLDRSLGMLSQASGKDVALLVNGALPGLPVRDAVFDVITANFLMNHIFPYEAALGEIVRALRSGGKLGMSVWGEVENEVDSAWTSVSHHFMDKETMAEALERALPSERWFSSSKNLEEALRAAGLQNVQMKRMTYRIEMSLEDYLEYKCYALGGRFLVHFLEGEIWQKFRQAVADELRSRFGESVAYTKDAHLAVGNKL